MRLWATATVLFFIYVAVVAALPGRPRPRRLGRLYIGVAVGLAFTLSISALAYQPILHDWLAPPLALLLAYWTSGLLFVAPREAQERALLAFDDRLDILGKAGRFPGPLATVLELAYTGVYPTIPLALALHLLFVPAPDPERFWSVVLITDYICFGFLAWVQTRPPRALERLEPWHSAPRRFNVRMLGASSIQANTFPSGHAAEALAGALLVVGAPWPIVLWMLINALAISAGAVFGRYHYAADAIAGWLVAIGVWMALR
jgi:membrane-associated phospholipid phosphatase